MIYKRYEFSLSQNGDKLVYIARNAAGNVVFREHSEQALKKAIDNAIREKERQAQLDLQAKLNKENNKKKKQEVTILAPAQKPVTRGADGKFISKSQLDQEEPKKKGFWDKLKS